MRRSLATGLQWELNQLNKGQGDMKHEKHWEDDTPLKEWKKVYRYRALMRGFAPAPYFFSKEKEAKDFTVFFKNL